MITRGVRPALYLLAVSLIAIVTVLTITVAPSHAAAFNLGLADGANSAKGNDMVTDLFGTTGVFHTITNVLLYLIGAVSVIMLIVGGLRYVISGGDSTAVQGAKNTILYAVVGVVVAIFAYAVVEFVISQFSGASGVGGSVAPTNT